MNCYRVLELHVTVVLTIGRLYLLAADSVYKSYPPNCKNPRNLYFGKIHRSKLFNFLRFFLFRDEKSEPFA